MSDRGSIGRRLPPAPAPHGAPVYDGRRSPARRSEIETKGSAFIDTEDGGNRLVAGFLPFRKTTETYAVRMDEAYEVITLEGKHDGKAGSYLACGAAGELYPIDEEIFQATYAPVKPPEDPARAFTRWFLLQPYERRVAWAKESGFVPAKRPAKR